MTYINQGEKGDPGEQGPKGDPGKNGSKGAPGRNVTSWFSSREPLITFSFFLILSVLSFTTIYTARQTAIAVKKADIIVQCTTPGTQCAKLEAESNALNSLKIQTAGFCALSVITQFPPTAQDRLAQQANLRAMYFTCFNDEYTKGEAAIKIQFGDTSPATTTTLVPPHG